MRYVVYYSIGSILFGLIVMIFYLNKKSLPGKKNTIYKGMIISALLSVIFDPLSAILEIKAAVIPRAMLYFSNMTFLIAMHTCLICFIYYLLLLVNDKQSKVSYIIMTIPYFLVVLCTLLSPTSKSFVFYIDENHLYQGGTLHMITYIVTATYLMFAVYILYIKGKLIRKITKLALLLTIQLLLVMTVIQIIDSKYLLTASATTIGITIMYFVLQMPSQYLESNTKAYNRTALLALLDKFYDSKERFLMTIISITSISKNSYLYNIEIDSKVLKKIYEQIKVLYQDSYICYIYFTDFVIISKYNQELNNYSNVEKLPKKIEVNGINVNVEIKTALIDSKYFKETTSTINYIDYIIYNKNLSNESNNISIINVNEEAINEYNKITQLKFKLTEMIDNNQISFKMKNICDLNNAIIYCELIPFIDTKEYENINYEELITIVKESNNLFSFTKKILDIVSNELSCFNDYRVISIKMEHTFFSLEESINIMNGYSKDFIHKVCLVFKEKDYSKMDEDTLGNITKLKNVGYRIAIDEFGIGYTNSNTLLYLDLYAVVVDKEELSKKMDEEKTRKFLSLIQSISKEINTIIICKNINKEKDIEMLNRLDIGLYQDDKVFLLNEIKAHKNN